MKIIKPQSLGVLHKPYTHLGKHYLSIAALGFFRLGADNPRFLTENLQWPHVVASLPAGMPLDDVMPKSHAEVLLLGSAHAPQQKACTSLQTQLRVDDAQGRPLVSKCLCVTGEREWRAGFLGARQVSKPKPFSSMALSYRRAYGGARNTVNPEGCGERPAKAWLSAASGVMPNIAYPAGIPASWRDGVAAGFGPIPIGNRARRRKFGSYGAAWRANDAPGFARDIDWSVFNMAPSDQWAGAMFEGGETYLLRNLHPRHAELTGKLPGLRARAFVLDSGKTADEARPVSLSMDTVWFLPDHDLGVVLYHGQTDIGDSDALDIGALMVAYEDVAAPKDEQHYHEVMALRLDRESARLHVFNESQLAPLPDDAERLRREQEQKAAEDAVLARSQQRIDLLDAQYWDKRGVSAPAGHRPARASLPALGVMTARTAAEGDFDLSDIVAKARALVAQVEQNGKEALAKIVPPVPAPVDPDALLAMALARAAVPAYDLLPAGQTGVDPQLATMLAKLPLPPADADPATLAADRAARANILKIPARRRQSRRAAPKLVLPALPYPQTVASELGVQIKPGCKPACRWPGAISPEPGWRGWIFPAPICARSCSTAPTSAAPALPEPTCRALCWWARNWTRPISAAPTCSRPTCAPATAATSASTAPTLSAPRRSMRSGRVRVFTTRGCVGCWQSGCIARERNSIAPTSARRRCSTSKPTTPVGGRRRWQKRCSCAPVCKAAISARHNCARSRSTAPVCNAAAGTALCWRKSRAAPVTIGTAPA